MCAGTIAAIGLLAAMLCAAAPALARRGNADARATRVYIRASYQLTRHARANLAATESAIHAFVSRTVAECPLAGEGSYTNGAANEVSEEVIGTMIATGYRPDAGAIHAFVAAVGHLRWSDRRLTRVVHAYVVKLENLAQLTPAGICGDVRSFAAVEFKTAPEATLNFDKLYLAADIEAEEVPLRSLAPYEDARDATLLRRTKQLEAPLADAEAKSVAEFMEIMRGLALSE